MLSRIYSYPESCGIINNMSPASLWWCNHLS